MAQSEALTNEGFGELGKLMSGEGASAFKKVVGIKTSCTANASQTFAGINKATESGFTLVNAASVASVQTTVANDTTQVDHVFTAGADLTIYGFGVCNDEGDVLFGLCCFAAAIPMQSATSDQLTIQMKVQNKAD